MGYYPNQANGWGLPDTGTGTLDKVRVTSGRLDHAVNEVLEDNTTNIPAYVTICGKVYEVLGDELAEIREACEDCKVPPLPDKADLRRRTDLAGQVMEQKTKTGTYMVRYNEGGYAAEASQINITEGN